MTEKTCATCKHRDAGPAAYPCRSCVLEASGEPFNRWEPAAPAPAGEPVAWRYKIDNGRGATGWLVSHDCPEEAAKWNVIIDSQPLYLANPDTTAPAMGVASEPIAWQEKVADAYAHLWHVNNEPMAPIPMRSPEKAAYEARKILRDMLTHEQRGEAINRIGRALGFYTDEIEREHGIGKDQA